MRKLIVLTITIVILVSSAAFAARTPKGSFLNSAVTDVQQLAQQVIDDAIVAARYAKHYQTPRNSVVDFFQNNLKVGRLKADYKATVYTITEGTNTMAAEKTLPAGSYVFITQDGRPFIEASTGNPLSSSIPFTAFEKIGENTSNAASGVASASSTSTSSMIVPTTDGVVTKVLGTEPIEVASAVTAVTEIVPSIPPSAVYAARGVSSLASVLPVAALVGGVAFAGSGGSSPSPPVGSVPEPGSMAAIVTVAVSALSIIRLKRRN